MEEQQSNAELQNLVDKLAACIVRFNELNKKGEKTTELFTMRLEISNLMAAIKFIKLENGIKKPPFKSK